MTWWWWALLWLALVIGALVVLFLVVRSLWRKGMALARELGEASDRLAAVKGELDTLAGQDGAAEDLAVFRSPAQLRAQRFTERRHPGSRGRSGDRSAPRA